MRTQLVSGLLMVLVVLHLGRLAGQVIQEFQIDPALSTVVVHVGRAGLFAFAGHDHEVAVPGVRGSIVLDPSDLALSRVTMQFEATSMRVTGRGEPQEDVPDVQRTMLSDRVLDVQRYATIAFRSDRISIQERSSDGFRLRVEGRVTLHGMSRPASIPVAVRLSGDRMTATGTATIRPKGSA